MHRVMLYYNQKKKKIKNKGDKKMTYTVKRWNMMTGEWSYFNTYRNYKAAAEASDELTRRYGGVFEIFEA